MTGPRERVAMGLTKEDERAALEAATSESTDQRERLTPGDMKFGHWYVVDVAHRPSNPIHRAIAFNARNDPNHPPDDHCDIMGSGYGPMTLRWRRLPYFEVICEITEMRLENNSYKLPPR